MRNCRPCGDRVLIKLKSTDKVTSGGIVIPDQYAERNQNATQEAYIMKIGTDAWKGLGSGEPWCKEGDLVKVLKYSGEDDKTIEENCIYRVIADSDILSVYEDEGWKE